MPAGRRLSHGSSRALDTVKRLDDFSILRVMSANPTDGLDSFSISGSTPVRSKTYRREPLDADHMRMRAMHACLVWRFPGGNSDGDDDGYYYCRGVRLSRRLMLRATMITTVTRTCLPRVAHQQF